MSKKKLYTVTLTLPNGKRKYYRGKTKKEAEAKRDKDKILLLKGVDVSDTTTFSEFAEVWFYTYKKGKLHIRSLETIVGILERYILPFLGDMRLKDIKPIDIQELMNTVSRLSLSTQKKVLQYTKAILQHAYDNNLIVRVPITSNIKPNAQAPEPVEALTDEQCSKLLNATKGTRVYPFLIVLRFCGLRKGEALGLMWKDIDFENKLLKVERSIVYTLHNRRGEINSDLKTESSKREIPMPEIVIDVLKEEKEKSKSLYVFSTKDGNYLSESSFRRMWDLVTYRTVGNNKSKTIECTIDFKVHPHQLRHTCITAWFESGLDIKEVQYLAGHATPEITMSIYTHYRKEQRFIKMQEKIAETDYSFVSSQ